MLEIYDLQIFQGPPHVVAPPINILSQAFRI